ncbi:hypothetical protein Poly24_44940 [Rosistilla carotiformis]|uniref:Uncharacterized protein n=1 Tax=Rosistilla carotiformis TaxID=2528017 RepID=A0A518JZ01_9BACT|nr:ATP-binding protein [Rosistilla carotiformis]QDV70768.1 hypothetical protein Poly24_44940 [Rosistilla carotiformis]
MMTKGLKQTLLPFDDQLTHLLTADEIYERCDQTLLDKLNEDNRIERKRKKFSGENIGEYVSMWANTPPDGGLMVIGQIDKKDGGGYDGFADENQSLINKVEKAASVFCADAKVSSKRVPVTNTAGKEDFVIVLRVHYHPSIVIKTSKGLAFCRRGDEKHELKPEEARELAVDKKQVNFEEEPCGLEYPSGFDMPAISQWSQKVRDKMGSGHGLSDEEVMANRFLGQNGPNGFVPNIACALLFAKQPRAIIPGCRVRFLRFDGTMERTGEKYNAVQDVWIEGTIPQMIRGAEQVLKTHLRTFSPLHRGVFYPVPEYPETAWYEAIVNACVHRSYGDGKKNVEVKIRMFDDHLDIESPGPFPPYVTADNIYDMEVPRNPRVFEAAYFLNLVRMNREGTRRIRDTMKEMQLPSPEFKQSEIGYSIVRVRLKNNIERRRVWVDQDISKIVGEAIVSQFSEDEKRVLNWIAEYGQCNVNSIVRLLDKEWGTCKKLLITLTRRKVLQYVRFKPDGERDSQAFFRLKSDIDLPDGSRDASDNIT